MRIHRVKIGNFRAITSVEVEFPTEGVTIIEGPNEIGKTSISEAIDLVLSERDDSAKRRVKSVQPVGRDVGAEVEIEMSSGPYRFVLRKRWHRQRETVLTVSAPHRLQLTGREAHDKVQEIIDETLDRDLWDALRIRQGAELHQAAFAAGSLGRALDAGAAVGGPTDPLDDLWERIEAEWSRYWTGGGQAKKERVSLGERVHEAKAAVERVEDALAKVEGDTQEVERLIGEAKALEARLAAQADEEGVLAARARTVGERRHSVALLKEKCETAEAKYDTAESAVRARVDLVERAERAADLVRELTAGEVPTSGREQASRLDLEEKVAAARGRVLQLENDHRRAVADREFRRHEIELGQLAERHERIVAALAARSAARAVVEAARVDEDLLRRIEDADIGVKVAEEKVASGVTKLVAEGLGEVSLSVDGEETPLGSGEQRAFEVADSIDVVVPGVVRISVRAGDGSRAIAEQQDRARQELREACLAGGVDDLTAARKAFAARKDAERALLDAKESIARDLRDLTAEEIEEKVAGLRRRVSAYESERDSDGPLPTDLSAARQLAEELEAALAAGRQELERLEEELSRVSQAHVDAVARAAERHARLEQARSALHGDEEAVEAARRAASDEELTRRLEAADSELAGCRRELEAAQNELAEADPDSVEVLLENARAAKKRLEGELHGIEITIGELRAKLEVRGEEGLAHKLDAAISEHDHLSATYEELEARAEAARLLYDTFSRHRAVARLRYVAPLRDSIEKLGRLVFGPTFEVDLDDDLTIARRTLDGDTLDFEELSIGAQEQLGMISRLAGASLVASDGGAPAIFDDALGWSDPLKLDRMGAVISYAGRSCQVIVLTCTPGRYASVGSAKVVRLPAPGTS
ncbi:MAG: AAA family ATPase [Actinomycetota bacterium]|nr:AAA family ATPase [Actinomycetota bacterium]